MKYGGCIADACFRICGDVKLRFSLEFLGKIGIRKTISEAIGYLFVIVPLRGRRISTDRRTGVAVSKYRIVISGLIVAVSNIDTFGLNQVVACSAAGLSSAAGEHFRPVFILEITHVLHGGSRHIIGCVDIRKCAGRAGASAKDI